MENDRSSPLDTWQTYALLHLLFLVRGTLMIVRRMVFSGFGEERHVVSELPDILSRLFKFLPVPASSKKLRPYMILDWH
jgi:hypothetical protein